MSLNRKPGIIWRIRAIKPSIHHDRDLAMAERRTGLPVIRVYQGLWSAADREGRFPWLVDEMQRNILPWDFDRWPIEKVLEVLLEGGWLVRYEADGWSWGWVPRLADHQLFNAHEARSSCPPPPPASVTAWRARYRPYAERPDETATEADGSPTQADVIGTQADPSTSGADATDEEGRAHVHARERTCNAPLGTRNLEPGGEDKPTTPATPRDGGAAAAHASPPPCLAGSSGTGTSPPAASPRASPPRGGRREPPGKPASVEQLRMLAEMAVERGTTLRAQAEALGLHDLAAIRAKHVTPLRQRLEALERVCRPGDGPPVIWADVRARLEAGEVAAAVASIRSLPEGAARAQLWERLDRYLLDRLPRDVSPQEVLEAAGVERVRQDPQRVWDLVERIRGGDRSMLPAPMPDDWRQRGGPLVSAICAAILAKGNGSSQQLRDRLQEIVDGMDLAALRGMHAELCPGGAS